NMPPDSRPSLHHSAADWCFFKAPMDAADYYRRLKAIGYDAVEMAAPQHWPLVRAAGLSLLNVSGPGMARGLNRAEHHAELLPQVRALIATAAANRIGAIILFSG